MMNDRDIRFWRDRNTPSLAVSADGGICYLDNMHPNYGKPMYVLTYKRCNSVADTFESACAWFDWIKEQLSETSTCPIERAVIALES